MSNLDVKRIIIRITIVISLTELVIMLVLASFSHRLGIFAEALVDVAILVLVASPVIYIWVIKPFVIARNEALAQLTKIAYHDQLTEVPNRHFLIEFTEKFIAEGVRHKFHGALILIDLDDFKPINDMHGHSAGDAVLVEVAKRLQSNIRTEDVVSRVGGDEFIILLKNITENSGLAGNETVCIAEKLQNILSEPITYKNLKLHIGSSFGIRLLSAESIGVDTAIREADVALYRAKKEGKGRIVVFEK